MPPPGKPLPGPHQPPAHLLPLSAPGRQWRSPQDGFDALHQVFGHHPARNTLAGKQEAPSQPIPLGRFLMQQPPALAAFLKAHHRPLIGAGMEGDAPADPALEHIVENLGLGHGHNGGGPDPEAAPRKGWPDPPCIRIPRATEPHAGQRAEPFRECRSMGRAGGVSSGEIPPENRRIKRGETWEALSDLANTPSSQEVWRDGHPHPV